MNYLVSFHSFLLPIDSKFKLLLLKMNYLYENYSHSCYNTLSQKDFQVKKCGRFLATA